MSDTHSHQNGGISSSRLTFSILLTLTFVVGEVIAGIRVHSLALVSDAGHNFADALALMLSAYALWVAKKPANPRKTFGYHRVGILAALVNAVALVLIAIFIAWEAFERIWSPMPVQGGPMIWVALIAIAVNVLIALWLHAGSKNDMNVRSAYVHMLGDAVAAFGVVIAGIIVALTGASIADPLVSLLIAALILWSSWSVLKESLNAILEGTPDGMDMGAVIVSMKNVNGVINVHDLHVWTVGPGVIACSCHVVVAEQSIRSGQQVLRAVKEELAHHHRINHATVQIEVEGCEQDEMYCTMHPDEEHAHLGHNH